MAIPICCMFVFKNLDDKYCVRLDWEVERFSAREHQSGPYLYGTSVVKNSGKFTTTLGLARLDVFARW